VLLRSARLDGEDIKMHIGRWRVDIFSFGWFLIGLTVLVVLAVLGLVGWLVFPKSN
jgi:hypothetical protein